LLVLGGVLAAGAFAGYCYFVESDTAPRAERPTARVSGIAGPARP
jgi:hypothetical protein